MGQKISSQKRSRSFNRILQAVPELTQAELLELISYLAQQARATAVSEPEPTYQWREIAGAAPNLLEGQDAQEWVNQIRANDWERDVY